MSKKKKSATSESEQPLVQHLVELRDRLLRGVIGVLLVFLALFPFANDLYSWLAQPLLAHLPEGTSMIATKVASPFFTPFKLTLVLAIFLAIPLLLYQAWSFIAPGLYQHERRMVLPLLLSSSLLFYLGAAFAYFVVFPLVFGFFTSVAPEGVSVMTDISEYLDFVLKMFFAFGLAFEVPIAVIVLVWMGIASRKTLAAKRPYIIVAAFVIGMLLTPPDAISQTLLAVPMILLFEFGLLFSKMFERKSEENEEDEAAAQTPAEEEETSVASTDEPLNYATAGEEDKEVMTDEEFDAEFDRAEAEEREMTDESPDVPSDKDRT